MASRRDSKWEVWEAFRQVRKNQGAAGVNGVSIDGFEADLKNNLYRIWNRMSSGTWYPPPVRAVEIPKPHGGGTRMLGIATVARTGRSDRCRPASGGSRGTGVPRRFLRIPAWTVCPLEAVERCRQRCWRRNWAVDLDVAKFFDTVPWPLIVKAVKAHCDVPWVLLYVKRWLAAPLQMPGGTLAERHRGTAQGSPVSPVLANLFMHYALDMWLEREYPDIWFERFADDAVLHCVSERQARQVLAALHDRMEQVGLRLHPAKTRIVYCQDGKRRGSYEHTSFTFLGFTFRARSARRKNGTSCSVVPARDQQGRPEEDQRRSPQLATAPPHHPHPRRTRQGHQSGRGGMDAVLRGVLPLRAVSPPSAHQRLPGAMDPARNTDDFQGPKIAYRKLLEIIKRYPSMFAQWRWVPWAAR